MKNNKSFSSIPSAFSLLELAITMGVIGILIAGVAISKKMIQSSNLTAARVVTGISPVKDVEDLAVWLESTSKDSFAVSERIDGASVSSWNDINLSQLINLMSFKVLLLTSPLMMKMA